MMLVMWILWPVNQFGSAAITVLIILAAWSHKTRHFYNWCSLPFTLLSHRHEISPDFFCFFISHL